MSFPRTELLPYYSYPGRVSNFGYSDYTHFTALAFDSSAITDNDIKISTADFRFCANTNCVNGMEIIVRRILNTKWPGNDDAMKYFGIWNGHVACGLEGILNEKTIIERAGTSNGISSYRYYSVPLNTVGFTTPESVNISYEGIWQENSGTSGAQYAYLWLGRYNSETENGRGMYPEVKIKYFVK